MTSSVRKKFQQKYGLIMQNKYLYINFNVLRNNNRHNWRLNKSSKTFWIDGDLWVFLNWFSEQIFFKSSCFFLLFQNSHFFGGVIFSKQLLFQNENFTEQPLLENEKFFTAVTFRNSCFSLFRTKISKNYF